MSVNDVTAIYSNKTRTIFSFIACVGKPNVERIFTTWMTENCNRNKLVHRGACFTHKSPKRKQFSKTVVLSPLFEKLRLNCTRWNLNIYKLTESTHIQTGATTSPRGNNYELLPVPHNGHYGRRVATQRLLYKFNWKVHNTYAKTTTQASQRRDNEIVDRKRVDRLESTVQSTTYQGTRALYRVTKNYWIPTEIYGIERLGRGSYDHTPRSCTRNFTAMGRARRNLACKLHKIGR